MLEDFSLDYPTMKVGRFTLKAGEKIPLHIHQNQYGLAYLLVGQCQIKTYEIVSIDEHLCELTLTSDSIKNVNDYCVLTPTINAHEITAIDNSTFLDVFSPGSQSGYLSTYLKVVTEQNPIGNVIAEKILIDDVDLPKSLKNNKSNSIIVS